MYTKPIPQPIVLFMVFCFIVLGFFAGRESAKPDNELDLNNDGEVTLQDFSIALYLVDEIQKELQTN